MDPIACDAVPLLPPHGIDLWEVAAIPHTATATSLRWHQTHLKDNLDTDAFLIKTCNIARHLADLAKKDHVAGNLKRALFLYYESSCLFALVLDSPGYTSGPSEALTLTATEFRPICTQIMTAASNIQFRLRRNETEVINDVHVATPPMVQTPKDGMENWCQCSICKRKSLSVPCEEDIPLDGAPNDVVAIHAPLITSIPLSVVTAEHKPVYVSTPLTFDGRSPSLPMIPQCSLFPLSTPEDIDLQQPPFIFSHEDSPSGSLDGSVSKSCDASSLTSSVASSGLLTASQRLYYRSSLAAAEAALNRRNTGPSSTITAADVARRRSAHLAMMTRAREVMFVSANTSNIVGNSSLRTSTDLLEPPFIRPRSSSDSIISCMPFSHSRLSMTSPEASSNMLPLPLPSQSSTSTTISNHNSSTSSSPHPPASFHCQICLEIEPMEFVSTVDVCEHQFGKDCLRSYIVSRLNENRFPIPCPTCAVDAERGAGVRAGLRGGVISSGQATRVGLTDAEYLHWNELALAQFQIKFHCEKCNNTLILDRDKFVKLKKSKKIMCPTAGCGNIWCKECQKAVEKGTKHSCDGKAELRKLMRKEGWKLCPGCNIPIQKREGCNHITCTAPGCNTHFCYRCGKILVRSVFGTDVYEATHAHFRRRLYFWRCSQYHNPGFFSRLFTGRLRAAR